MYRILVAKDEKLLIELQSICHRFHWDKLITSIKKQLQSCRKEVLIFQLTKTSPKGIATICIVRYYIVIFIKILIHVLCSF